MTTRFHSIAATLAVVLSMAAYCAATAEEPASIKFSKRCLMISPNEGCAIADVNRDGKPDVIAGTCWFAAPEFIPRPLRDIPEVYDVYFSSNGDHACDVDGDGWVDVISIGWMTPELCWYKNPGKVGLRKGKKWKRFVLKKTRRQNEAMELRDLDGDAVPEIVVNSWDKKAPAVAWKLAKSDDGRPTAEKVVLGNQGSGHGYAFGDINGDGREDFLCETGWYERPEGDPLAKPWKFHAETALPHPSCPCLIVDLTGDGRSDIIWGRAHDFGLYWWEQREPKPDRTTTWTEHLIDKSWSQAHSLVWADLDGDGRKELITGKRVRAHNGNDPGGKEPECMYYYTWNRAAGKFTRHTISPPGGGVGIGMQIRVADLSGDGRPDIAVAGKTGTWVLFNEGPSS